MCGGLLLRELPYKMYMPKFICYLFIYFLIALIAKTTWICLYQNWSILILKLGTGDHVCDLY